MFKLYILLSLPHWIELQADANTKLDKRFCSGATLINLTSHDLDNELRCTECSAKNGMAGCPCGWVRHGPKKTGRLFSALILTFT